MVKEKIKNFKVDFAIQKNQLGTADAVKSAIPKVNDNSDVVVVLNGDDSAFYKPETIQKLINLHLKEDNIITFLSAITKNPQGLGRVYRKNGIPIEIIEEKDADKNQKEIREINCGLYVFNKNWLEKNTNNVKKSEISGEYYLVDLIRIAVSQKQKIDALILENFSEWHGVNNPEDLKKANELAIGQKLKIHFMGIRGAGESAVASLAKAYGHKVSGCDINPSSPYTQNINIDISEGHDQDHLKDIDMLVISPAVSLLNPKNPELIYAKENQIPTLTWQEFQGKYLQQEKFVITIAGAYGKSTTTAMTSKILEDAKLDPTCVIGAKVLEWGTNFRVGNSEIFVSEADEYNDNFLNYNSDIAVILNVTWDHPDFFKTKKSLLESYKKYISNIKTNGTLIIGKGDDLKNLAKTARDDIKVINVDDFGKYNLSIIGDFRKENADAALTIAKELNLKLSVAKKTVEKFKGLGRRLENKGTISQTTVFDDYAVQPYTIKATTNALRNKFKNSKIILVLEPHTFSRIEKFFESFVKSLREINVDKILITDVYAAREKGDEKMLAKKLATAIGKNCQYTGSIKETGVFLKNNLTNFDIVLSMGAGNVYQIYDLLKENK